jgi:hypothetical protein
MDTERPASTLAEALEQVAEIRCKACRDHLLQPMAMIC